MHTTPTTESAGVKLQRAFDFGKTKNFDPFLLLDDFRNENPPDCFTIRLSDIRSTVLSG